MNGALSLIAFGPQHRRKLPGDRETTFIQRVLRYVFRL